MSILKPNLIQSIGSSLNQEDTCCLAVEEVVKILEDLLARRQAIFK